MLSGMMVPSLRLTTIKTNMKINNQTLAEDIWIAVLHDLTSRGSIRQAWDEIDLDILQEIANTNIATIKELLDAH